MNEYLVTGYDEFEERDFQVVVSAANEKDAASTYLGIYEVELLKDNSNE